MVKYGNPGPILSRWPRGKASHPAPEPRSRPSRQCGDGHIPSALSRQSPDVKLLDSPGKQPGHVNHVIDNWIAIYYWIAIWSIWVYMQLLACESWRQRMLTIIFVLESFSASIFQPYESGKAKLWRCQNIGGSMGNPNSWMVYFMEHPIEMDDVGVPPWMG